MKALSARRFEENRDRPLHESLREVSGFTLGTVGLGGIGTNVAYRAHYGFGMRILAVDPKPCPSPPSSPSCTRWIGCRRWFHRSMCSFAALPHTKESTHMLNESIFRAMKPTAYFINVSRGTLVDTPALVRALKEGWIAGAGLDVTDPEPLPPDHPLWTAGNVIITSHTSGRSDESIERASGPVLRKRPALR